jgi:hypothetical protein
MSHARTAAVSTIIAAFFAGPGLEIPPPSVTAQGDVAVTIYNNNLALVQDRRQLDLPAGRSARNSPTSPPRSGPRR